jgi:5'-3' exonuclease
MDNLLMNIIEPMNFIIIDGSYYNFYRFHSLLTWWKNAYPDIELNEPHNNSIFVDKFRNTFISNLANIPKKLNIHNSNHIMIVGKDCKRENIWRNKLYPEYKANRKDERKKVGPLFKMVYDSELFIQGGSKLILQHPHLEADDCIAITTKYLLNKFTNCNIYIITSDYDYLQLVNDRVHLYNLAFKKNRTNDANCDLFCKILTGDKSDNIPSVFPKCGPKTALKYYNNYDLFQDKLNSSSTYQNQYELNRNLIDFNYIPSQLVLEFMNNSFA